MFRPQLLAAVALAAAFASTALAQAQFRPPADLRDSERAEPAQGTDPGGLMLRIDRLENQVRNLTGQIEQMQFANRKLEEQLRKFQQDVEFRLQENGGRAAPGARPQTPPPGRRTESEAPAAYPSAESTPLSQAPPTRLSRRGDAFDPDANPGAPGAPRPLGTPQPLPRGPSAPIQNGALIEEEPADIHAPVDLMRRNPQISPPAAPGGLPNSAAPAQAALPQGLPAPGGLQPTPREDFDRAAGALRAGQFEAAETGFRAFLQKYPKNALVASATFNLGESYFRRQRAREAAEQFLKVTTDYSKWTRAPEALVRLGLSLEKLGVKEQACAAYGEVGRKYPNANASVRASAERESQRAQC